MCETQTVCFLDRDVQLTGGMSFDFPYFRCPRMQPVKYILLQRWRKRIAKDAPAYGSRVWLATVTETQTVIEATSWPWTKYIWCCCPSELIPEPNPKPIHFHGSLCLPRASRQSMQCQERRSQSMLHLAR